MAAKQPAKRTTVKKTTAPKGGKSANTARPRQSPPKKAGVPAVTKPLPPIAKPLTFDFSEIFNAAIDHAGLKAINAEKVLAAHGKQLAALGEANYHALETMRQIIALQAEILQDTLEAGAKATQDLAKQGGAGAGQMHGEAFMQDVLDRALNSMRLLSESVAQANADALSKANEHVQSSLEDIENLGRQLRQ